MWVCCLKPTDKIQTKVCYFKLNVSSAKCVMQHRSAAFCLESFQSSNSQMETVNGSKKRQLPATYATEAIPRMKKYRETSDV